MTIDNLERLENDMMNQAALEAARKKIIDAFGEPQVLAPVMDETEVTFWWISW